MISENNTSSRLDNLLRQATQTEEEKRTQEKEKKIKFVSDLGLRWQQILYSDLGREPDSILDVHGDEMIHRDMIEKSNMIRSEISTKESALEQKIEKAEELLADEGLDSDMRRKITRAVKEEQQNWKEERTQLEAQQGNYHKERSEAHFRVLENEGKIKIADEKQGDFKRYSIPEDLQFYKLDPKEAGEKLFQILIERPENEQERMKTFREWIYNNMLQGEEQKFIDKLVEKGWKEVPHRDEILREAKKQFQNKISEIVQFRTEGEDFESKLQDIESELSSVDRAFENFESWVHQNTDQTVSLSDLEKDLHDLIQANQKELKKWEQSKTKTKNKKRINRNNRLYEEFVSLKKKADDEQADFSEKAHALNTVLYHLREELSLTERSEKVFGKTGREIVSEICWYETPHNLDDLPQEIYVLAEKLFSGKGISGVLKRKIHELEKSSFLDVELDKVNETKTRVQNLKRKVDYHARGIRLEKIKDLLEKNKRKEVRQSSFLSKMKTVPDKEW